MKKNKDLNSEFEEVIPSVSSEIIHISSLFYDFVDKISYYFYNYNEDDRIKKIADKFFKQMEGKETITSLICKHLKHKWAFIYTKQKKVFEKVKEQCSNFNEGNNPAMLSKWEPLEWKELTLENLKKGANDDELEIDEKLSNNLVLSHFEWVW